MIRLARRWCTAASLTVFLIGADPAWGISGLEVVSATSPSISTAFKVKVAYCPAAKRVVGGGGLVLEAPITLNPTLTGLQPIRRYDGERDAYIARAAETRQGTSQAWSLSAYAVCANALGLGPWSIRRNDSATSSSAVKAIGVGCPPGRRVLGTGISISRPSGRVVIQVARTAASGDIVRAQAREGAGGTGIDWSVAAYAICGVTPSGFVIPPFARSTPIGELPNDSNSQVIADRRCPDGKSLLGPGGAVSTDAPPQVSIQGIFPTAGGKGAQAIAVENTPTPVRWGFAVASASCASS